VRWLTSYAIVALSASWLVFVSAPAQGGRLGASAPDVAGDRWINSEPLTTPGLRGRVVLVEFWTFG
jgi:hypothetical protein